MPLQEATTRPSDAQDARRGPGPAAVARHHATMFVIEIGAGWWARSAGLLADAMDMFADAAVYGVALYATGRTARHKLAAAKLAGILQLLLALGALRDGRHVFQGIEPASLADDRRVRARPCRQRRVPAADLPAPPRRRAHDASYIFSANDVIANLGVIAAGLLVSWTGSPWPIGSSAPHRPGRANRRGADPALGLRCRANCRGLTLTTGCLEPQRRRCPLGACRSVWVDSPPSRTPAV